MGNSKFCYLLEVLLGLELSESLFRGNSSMYRSRSTFDVWISISRAAVVYRSRKIVRSRGLENYWTGFHLLNFLFDLQNSCLFEKVLPHPNYIIFTKKMFPRRRRPRPGEKTLSEEEKLFLTLISIIKNLSPGCLIEKIKRKLLLYTIFIFSGPC